MMSNIVRGHLLVSTVAMCLSLSPFPAGAQSASGIECERLASSPLDTGRPLGIAGVAYEKISPEPAISACTAALKESPAVKRYLYNLARALDRAQRYKESYDYYMQVEGPLQAFANNNAAGLLERGNVGGKPDMARAFELYQRAAEGGLDIGKYNAARFLREGLHGAADKPRALALFEEAARGGFSPAMEGAASMLEAGEGLPGPSVERAALYWRKLADSGNAEMASKLGIAMKEGKLPGTAPEIEHYLNAGFAGGHPEAGIALAGYLMTREPKAETRPKALAAAVRAYLLSRNSAPESDGAWIVFQRDAGTRIVQLAGDAVPPGLTAEDFKMVKEDFGDRPLKRFTIPMTCNSVASAQYIYVWQWQRSYPSTDPQFSWLEKRGCAVPQAVVESFRKLFVIAKENNVDFPDLAMYALAEAKNEDTEKKTLESAGKKAIGESLPAQRKAESANAETPKAARQAQPTDAEREAFVMDVANKMASNKIDEYAKLLTDIGKLSRFNNVQSTLPELISSAIAARLEKMNIIPTIHLSAFSVSFYTKEQSAAIRSMGMCLMEATDQMLAIESDRLKRNQKPDPRVHALALAKTEDDAHRGIGAFIGAALELGETEDICPTPVITEQARRQMPQQAACGSAAAGILEGNTAGLDSVKLMARTPPDKRAALLKQHSKPLSQLCNSWRKHGAALAANQCEKVPTAAVEAAIALRPMLTGCPK